MYCLWKKSFQKRTISGTISHHICSMTLIFSGFFAFFEIQRNSFESLKISHARPSGVSINERELLIGSIGSQRPRHWCVFNKARGFCSQTTRHIHRRCDKWVCVCLLFALPEMTCKKQNTTKRGMNSLGISWERRRFLTSRAVSSNIAWKLIECL